MCSFPASKSTFLLSFKWNLFDIMAWNLPGWWDGVGIVCQVVLIMHEVKLKPPCLSLKYEYTLAYVGLKKHHFKLNSIYFMFPCVMWFTKRTNICTCDFSLPRSLIVILVLNSALLCLCAPNVSTSLLQLFRWDCPVSNVQLGDMWCLHLLWNLCKQCEPNILHVFCYYFRSFVKYSIQNSFLFMMFILFFNNT